MGMVYRIQTDTNSKCIHIELKVHEQFIQETVQFISRTVVFYKLSYVSVMLRGMVCMEFDAWYIQYTDTNSKCIHI